MNALRKNVCNPASRTPFNAPAPNTSSIARATPGARLGRGPQAAPQRRRSAELSALSCALLAAGLIHCAAAQASSCRTGTNAQAAPSGGQCAIPPYHPPGSNEGLGGAVVTDGDTVTLHGTSPISTGYSGNTTVDGSTVNVVSGTFQSSALVTGGQSVAVAGPNDAAGVNVVYRVYDSSAFVERSNANTPVNQFEDVDGDMYYRASLGKVEASGGTLNVKLGDAPMGAPADNAIVMVSKQTYLTSADGSGDAASSVNWQSRNLIDMGIDPGLPTPDENGIITVQVPVTTYAGSVAFNGTTYTVTNAAEMARYNDALVAALKSGVLTSQAEYDQAFARAYTTTDMEVRYQTNTSAGDLARTPNGDRYVVLAHGANGSAVIERNAQIDVVRASGAIKATGGATASNRGTLSGHIIQQVVRVESGARFVNEDTGVVSSGYLAGDRLNTAEDPAYYYTGSGILATGAGSTVQNSGIINTAGFAHAHNTSIGMGLDAGASGNNDGAINVGVNPGYVSKVVGVNVSGGSSFANSASGVIYIGRAAQYESGEAAPDVAAAGPSYGIRIMDTGDRAVNDGQITIGSLTQNAVAMYSTAPLDSLLQNNGTITIEGAAGGTPFANIGMMADDNGAAGTGAIARNAGIINVNGVNGIGIMVNANPGTAANAESTGTINVSGDVDIASGTRNFGVWVDGALGVARIGGAVNLSGTGAIGIHAQDGGTIHVSAGAVPRFLAGTDQIAFYASGAGSTIDVDSSTMSVTTDRSTMFRVADGAAFSGTTTGGALRLTVAGTDARGVVATGLRTVLSTGASTYDVTGAAGADGGAAAIVVEGGAAGVIEASTTINLSAAGATAGIVDGQGHDLTGAARGTPVATTLDNQAGITSSTAGVTGFVARDLGTLVNDGAVSLSGAASVGVVADARGQVLNRGLVHVADGDGVQVRGARAVLVNEGLIRADDGSAAVRLTGAGASVAIGGNGLIRADGGAAGVLLDDTNAGGAISSHAGRIEAHGAGAAIDNRAPDARIALSNTTVTATAPGGVGIRSSGAGAQVSLEGSTIQGVASGIAITGTGGGGQVSRLDVTGGSIAARTGNAIDVDGAHAAITVRGAEITAGSGTLLSLTRASLVDFTMEGATLVGDVIADAASRGTVNLRAGSMLTGRIDPVAVDIDTSSTWNVTADSDATTLSNAGAVVFVSPIGDPAQPASYKTVTVTNYVGNGGTIALNTYLDGGGRPSDRLVVDGGTATGTTGLRIVKTGRHGVLTSGDGINVVEMINGGTTAPGAFRLASPVQSGPYEYLLYRGGAATPNDFYLRSYLGQDGSDSSPVAYRPAVTGYALTPALNLDYGFSNMGRLHERVGDIASTEHRQKGGHDGVWGRIGGAGLDVDSGSRYAADQDTFFMQFGRDWTLSRQPEGGSTHAGVTASLGTSKARFRDRQRSLNDTLSDDTGSTTTQAQSIGGYYTRYWQDATYWDSVAQATHYRNKYYDAYGGSATQNGYGLALSQEVGKPFALMDKLAIEPQAQLLYQYLRLNDFDDGISGVSGGDGSALRGRLGVRLFVPGLGAAGGAAEATPYLTVDVLRDLLPSRKVRVDDVTIRPDMGRTWLEVGGGVSASVGASGHLYAVVKVSKNIGGEERRGLLGQVGYRYSW